MLPTEDAKIYVRVTRLERNIEIAFIKKARAAGFLVRKMNGEGYRGWPDLLVEGSGPEAHWYIEFKAPGRYRNVLTGLSANQIQIVNQLKKLGKKVLVTDSLDEAWEFIHGTKEVQPA